MKLVRRILLITMFIVVIVLGSRWVFFNHLENTAPLNQSPTSNQWQHSSEQRAYPDVNQYPKLWILVSKKRQRVYLINHGHVLYTMYASTGTGKDNNTPTGNYHIQAERGNTFYNAKSGEGARYWVSWKNHGEYLFHSVPINSRGQYIISEAQELGNTANSHGCVRLSVPDAKWMYQNIKQGTKVVITNQ